MTDSDIPERASGRQSPTHAPELDPLLAEHPQPQPHPDAEEPESEHVDEDLKTTRAREGDKAITYTLFLLLGGGALLGWNSFIVSLQFFAHSALRDSSWAKSFPSTLSFVLTAANLISLVHAIRTQKYVNPEARNVRALVWLMALLLPLALYATQSPDLLSPPATYVFLLLSAAGVSAAGSYLQNATLALASVFGPLMMAASLSGQGMIGLAVAVAQYFSALHGSKTAAAGDHSDGHPPRDSSRNAAMIFFALATLYAALTLAFQLLVSRRLASYQHLAQLANKLNHDHTAPVSFRQVERKVRTLGLAVFLIFTVTISVFPAITSSIMSVRVIEDPTSFFAPSQFVAFGFVVFNVADWLGRSLPSWPSLRVGSPHALVLFSCIRIVFIPLFLMCHTEGSRSSLLHSDLAFFLIMFAFALSNGYLSTLCFVAGIELPSLDAYEVDLAGTCLALFLTFGLVAGALLSFPLSALV